MKRDSLRTFHVYDMEDCIPELTEAIEKFYDLGKVVSMERTKQGETNRNFIIACNKGGKSSKYFCKLYSADKTIEMIGYEYAFSQHFRKNSAGVMDCADFILTNDGDYCLQANVELIGKPALFAVFTLLPGETWDEEDWRGDKMNSVGRRAVASGLAMFHVFARGFNQLDNDSGLVPGITDDMERWYNMYTNQIEQMNGVEKFQPYYDYFTSIRDEFMGYFNAWREEYMRVIDQIPLWITHGDTGPNNYRYENYVAVGACDLDWIKIRPRIFDLAFSMVELLARFNPEDFTASFDLNHVRAYVDDYDAAVEKYPEFELGKLTALERRLLPCMMGLVSVQMFNYDRCGYIFSGNSCCSVEDHVGVTAYGFAIIRTLFENQQALIDALVK